VKKKLFSGCIGYPNHPVWEITTACNLHCRHCHASGGRRSPDELTTSEGKRLLLELTGIDAFRMIVFTGGEPLVCPDIFKLAEHASRLGLVPVIATLLMFQIKRSGWLPPTQVVFQETGRARINPILSITEAIPLAGFPQPGYNNIDRLQ